MMGKRELKSANIKVSILNATLELLQNRNFDQVYVTDICERCNISKVTFFKYFPSKGGYSLLLLQGVVPENGSEAGKEETFRPGGTELSAR